MVILNIKLYVFQPLFSFRFTAKSKILASFIETSFFSKRKSIIKNQSEPKLLLEEFQQNINLTYLNAKNN